MENNNDQRPRIKACASLRMSTLAQDTSIEIQRERLLVFAERNGYEIIDWYIDEGKSGCRHVEKRTEWLRMLAEAKSAEWEVVLSFSRDRFSRLDSFEVVFAKQALRKAGKKLHCIEHGIADWETGAGRVMDAMRDEACNETSVKISKATTEGRLNKFIKTRHYPKQCPYGFARMVADWDENERLVSRTEGFMRPDGWTQTYVPGDPAEQEVARWIYQTYATKDIGFRAIAHELNKKGVPSPDGLKWNSNTVRRILTNPTFVGDLRLGRTLTGKFHRLDNGEVVKVAYSAPTTQLREGKILHGTHQGIIDRPLWELVQEKIRRRTMRVPQLSGSEGGYSLAKVLHCGHCGARMYGRRNIHSRKEDGIIGYVCSHHFRFGDQCGCFGWSIDEKDILPVLIDKLTEAVDMRLLEFYSLKQPSTEAEGATGEVAVLRQKLAEIEKRIERGAKRLTKVCDDIFPLVEKELCELRVQQELLKQKLLKAERPEPHMEIILQEWQEWLSAAKKDLIQVQTSPVRGAKFDDLGHTMTSDSFREALLRFGCHVDVWWTPRSKKRWDIDRVRIRFGIEEPETKSGDGPVNGAGDDQQAGNQAANPQTATCNPLHVAVWGFAIDLVFSAKDLFPQSLNAALPLIKEQKGKGASHQDIADHLNRQGLKTAEQNTWTANSVTCFLRNARRFRVPA